MHQKLSYRYLLRALVIFVILLGAYFVYLNAQLPFSENSSEEEVTILNED